MGIGRSLLLAAAQSPALNSFALKSRMVRRATRAFMPGERMEDALDAGARIAGNGRGLLYTRLGEALTERAESVAVRDHYLELFDAIKARGLPGQVSVKPTQLGIDLSVDDCRAHCLALAARAEATGSTLWIDMEDSSYVDRTLELYAAIKAVHARAGIALQAYLFRTPDDVRRLLPLKPVIRLVKGAYAEPATMAYPVKRDTDAAYESLASMMLEATAQGQCKLILGTHDMPLIDRIRAKARALGVTPGQYEIHMLYGIRDREQQQLRAAGESVSTLVSYGEAWYRWYMRRLAERPANVWFVVRSAFPTFRSAARALVLGAAIAAGAACAPAEPDPSAGKAVVFNEANWKAPTEAEIPTDSMGASIRRGLYLLRHTPDSLPQYARSGLSCTSCHQLDGTKLTSGPLTGSHARFPKYLPRTGAVISLADRVNYCFTRSLAGNVLPVDSREMTDLLAYIAFISRDVPVGVQLAGASGLPRMPEALDGDAVRGERLYTEKTCVACHGVDGNGVGPLPPLWGPRSYSIGASMSRIERAASFIYHNMPQTAPGSLTPQEAFDLAAYINGKPRPDSPAKEGDWPMGGNPADVPYDLRSGHRAFRPPPLLPRATPSRAVVPVPPRAASGSR
jgi:cytochrome c/proline dehydrogenase